MGRVVPISSCHHAAMRIDAAEGSLRGYPSDVGVGLVGASTESAFAAMMEWYAAERADDASSIEEDGDMLR